MNNKSGSVMIIILGFVVVFTLLGMASIHYAGTQNLMAEELKSSSEAFWLADGAIEQSKGSLPNVVLTGTTNIDGNRYFTVSTKPKTPTNTFEWDVLASGNVFDKSRKIEATISYFNIAGDKPVVACNQLDSLPAFLSEDEIRIVDDCLRFQEKLFPVDDIVDNICDETNSNVTTYDEVIPTEGAAFEDEGGFANITCLDVALDDTIHIPTPNNPTTVQDSTYSQYNILLVDVRDLNKNGKIPEVTFESHIDGVVYFVGDTKLVNPDITGVLLLEGDSEIELDKSLISNIRSDVRYEEHNVNQALSLLDIASLTGGGSALKVVKWEEVHDFE